MVVAERYPITEPKFNNRVGNRQKTRARLKRVVFIKTIVVILGVVILNTVIQSLVVQKSYQINTEKNEIRAMGRELNKIRIEIAGLSSYDRIQYRAKNELRMKLAAPGDFRRIAAVPDINRELPQSYQQNMWGKLAAWVGRIGETLANTP